MAVLNPVYVDGRKFHWKGNEGVAEISDLGIRGFEQVYDDACDIGITVQGKRENVIFTMVSYDRNGENVAGWHLVSLDKRGRIDNRFKLLIIND